MSRASLSTLLLLLGFGLAGCPQTNTTDPNSDPNTSDTTGGDVSDVALSFGGTLTGSAKTTSSTTESSGQAARRISAREIGDDATAWLTDLDGNRLLDADGNEYPDFAINADGSFELDGLPVGVDFVLNIDVDGDGEADLQTFVHIPANDDGTTGELDELVIDPLSTLVLAKFLALLEEQGIQFSDDLELSPSALIHRIRDAFANLFLDSGVEQDILIDDLFGLTRAQLAALFDVLIPPAAQRGMNMAKGSLLLKLASDVNGVAAASAQILLEGGFVILDLPDGPDFSFLANLPNVESHSTEEFHAMFGGQGDDQQVQNDAALPPPPPGTVYFSSIAEPDRNFVNSEFDGEIDGPDGPWFSDRVLSEMARIFVDGGTVSMSDLHQIIVDAEIGMGARYQYFIHTPQGGGEFFETADGLGLARSLQDLFARLQQEGADDTSPDNFEAVQSNIRRALLSFLDGTAEPTFERLFDGILITRIPSTDAYGRLLRNQRAHLPFSRSGPSRFFVVADKDAFQDATAKAITVNPTLNEDGEITSVSYVSDGTGKYYLRFGPHTDTGMLTELINRTTSGPLRDFKGRPQLLDLGDTSVFQSVGGESFLDAFSQTGEFYPGAPALTVPNPQYDPNQPADPNTNPPVFQRFVLVSEPGPNGVPVRVDYANNVASILENGQYYLGFTELTQTEGKFELIDESGQVLLTTPGDFSTRVLVIASQIQGGAIVAQNFRHIFGIDVPNPGYDPNGAPYYDDFNGNNIQEAGEPSFDHRAFLHNPDDWRSTRIEAYYRRADNNGFVDPQNVDFNSSTPRTLDGVTLVPRNFRPRLNAFRFGRPNVTLNLLCAFSPPEFFNGTQALNADTRLNPFQALAMANLVFGGVQNAKAWYDPDGAGPIPGALELVEAHLFVAPIGDPVQLMVKGFDDLAIYPGAP